MARKRGPARAALLVKAIEILPRGCRNASPGHRGERDDRDDCTRLPGCSPENGDAPFGAHRGGPGSRTRSLNGCVQSRGDRPMNNDDDDGDDDGNGDDDNEDEMAGGDGSVERRSQGKNLPEARQAARANKVAILG